jgi:hypothetical protein
MVDTTKDHVIGRCSASLRGSGTWLGARLCENPVFGAHGLCSLLILLACIFEKSAFDTASRIVGLHTNVILANNLNIFFSHRPRGRRV